MATNYPTEFPIIGRERTTTLVKDWITEAGLRAMITKTTWSNEVTKIAPSLKPYCCGYVESKQEVDVDDLAVPRGHNLSTRSILNNRPNTMDRL